ncbi:hypothetical protein KKC94_02195 [Patescibacteria group bacterium]|nr:hypothetical protein [Patescibacteria group bacterium]
MRTHRYHNQQDSEKNLILGGGSLVFANGGPTGTGGTHESGPTLGQNELLTKNNDIVELKVERDILSANNRKIPLTEIEAWIQPGTEITQNAPTDQQLNAAYDYLNWELTIGTHRLRGYRGKAGSPQEGNYFLLIVDDQARNRGLVTPEFLAPAKKRTGGGNVEELSVPPTSEAFNTKEKVPTIIPGPEAVYFESGDRESIERTWNAMFTEYHGFDGYVKSFNKMKVRLQKADVPDDIMEDLRWIGPINRLQEEFASMYQAMDAGRFKSGFNMSPKSIRNLKLQTRDDVLAALDQIIADMEKQRDRAMKELYKQMRKDFNKRLKFLKKRWETKPPKHFEDLKDNYLNTIDAVLKQIKNNLTDDEPFQEYIAVYQTIKKLEDQYAYAKEARSNEISIDQLEREYEALVEKKKNDIDPKAKELSQEAAATLSELEELERIIKNNSYIEEDYKKNELETLEKQKNIIRDWGNISNIYDDIFSDEEYFRNEKGEKILFKSGDKPKFQIQQGLRLQLNALKSGAMDKGDTISFANGLHEAFEKYDKLLDETRDNGMYEIKIARNKISSYIELYKNIPEPGSGYEWQFISLQNVKRAGEIIKEWATRRYNRDQNLRLGKTVFKVLKPLENLPYVQTLPNEFDKMKEQAEQEEVNHYKDIYGNKDAWQIQDVARTTNNQDELKACLYLLADRGRIRWDDPGLLKQFNKFQDQIVFDEDISVETLDMSRFMSRLQKVVGVLWDYDTFNEWYNTNNSNYESGKQKNEERMNRIAEYSGGLQRHLKGLLKRYKEKGEAAKVDPHEYEEAVDYSIIYGKMTGEAKLYYLIQGIATGLLSADRGSAINSKRINNYPVIDYFGSSTARGEKPNLKDIREVAALNWEDNEPGPMYLNWFETQAMRLQRVQTRIDKVFTGGQTLDHDDSTAFLAYVNDSTATEILRKQSNGYTLPMTGMQNWTVAHLQFMDSAAFNEYDKKDDTRDDLVRFVSQFVTMDAITSERMYKNQTFFRWGSSGAYESVPRAVGAYTSMFKRGNDYTVRKNMETCRSYVRELDPDFFDPLFNGTIKSNEQVKQFVENLKKKYEGKKIFGDATDSINTVDDLYKAAGAYTRFLFSENPEIASRMLQKVRDDQAKNGAKENMDKLKKAQVKYKNEAWKTTGVTPPPWGETLWYVGPDHAERIQNPANNNSWFGSGEEQQAA